MTTPPERFVWRKGYSADGRRYVGMVNGDFAADGAVVWADAATDAVERTFPAPAMQVRLLEAPDEGRTIRAVAGLRDDSTVVITWDVGTGAEARRAIRGPGAGFSRPLAFAPGGQAWAYLDKARDAVQVWDGAADRPLGPPLRTPSTARNLAAWAWAAALFAPDGRTLILGRSDGQIEFWDLADFHLLRLVRLFPAGYTVMHLQITPDGRTLAASGNVLMTTTWAGRHWEGVRHFVTGEDISEATREVVLLDLPTNRIIARSPGSAAVEFAPDSRSAVTIERDRSITIRDIPRPEAR